MCHAPADVVSRLKFSVTNQSNLSVAGQLLPFQAVLLAVCRGVHVVVMRGSVVLHRCYLSACRDWHRCFTNLVGCTRRDRSLNQGPRRIGLPAQCRIWASLSPSWRDRSATKFLAVTAPERMRLESRNCVPRQRRFRWPWVPAVTVNGSSLPHRNSITRFGKPTASAAQPTVLATISRAGIGSAPARAVPPNLWKSP
jgi:hypothetical protein